MTFLYIFAFLILLFDSIINITCFYNMRATSGTSFTELPSVIMKVIVIGITTSKSADTIIFIVSVYTFLAFSLAWALLEMFFFSAIEISRTISSVLLFIILIHW